MEIADSQNSKFLKMVRRIWNGPYEDENEEVEGSCMRQDRMDEMRRNDLENDQRGDRYGSASNDLGGGNIPPEWNNQRNHEEYEEQPAVNSENVTVISKGTVIVGDIKSDSDIEMFGEITGNVTTTGNVKINGKQAGDVQGSSINLFSCIVKGNMNAAEDINVDSDSVVVGDIKCGNLTIDGKLKGNIHVMGNVSCEGNAIILGDIASTTISINSGAKIKGNLEVSDGSIEQIKIDEDEKAENPPEA